MRADIAHTSMELYINATRLSKDFLHLNPFYLLRSPSAARLQQSPPSPARRSERPPLFCPGRRLAWPRRWADPLPRLVKCCWASCRSFPWQLGVTSHRVLGRAALQPLGINPSPPLSWPLPPLLNSSPVLRRPELGGRQPVFLTDGTLRQAL